MQALTYSVSDEAEKQVKIGKRVLVPLGKRSVTGYIVGVEKTSEREDIREIKEILDQDPLFDEDDLKFYRWVSEYYLYPLGKTLKAILPGGIDVESGLRLSLSPDRDHSKKETLSDTGNKIVTLLEDFPSGISLKHLKTRMSEKNLRSHVTKLQELGFLKIEERLGKSPIGVRKEMLINAADELPSDVTVTEKQGDIYRLLREKGEVSLSLLRNTFKNVRPTLRSMEKKGIIRVSERECYRRPRREDTVGRQTHAVTLTPEQDTAVGKITEAISSGTYAPFLLHGITGSGKTEIYLRAIEEVLRMNGSVLFLVPEIALTPQLLSRINERFDENLIAILHSGISRGVKYDEWRRIERGEARIIAGARSAVFAPVRNLKLIIVDEEHDDSYKQDDHLMYNARDIAVVRAKMNSASVLLGSATPGIQTYFNTKGKGFTRLTLTKRVEGRPLPVIDIVDMKNEREERGDVPMLSKLLKNAIGSTLADGKQALLFLNRRGFNTFFYCVDCGHVFTCRNCSISLTHHAGEGVLRCHYCGYSVKAPPMCSGCGGTRVRSYGMGTEKLEDEIRKLYPKARVARMDSDSTVKKGSHGKILKAFDKGETDILIGTQMITKGHDYPNVTLVGVVSADSSLNIPDFRASERTFQIITQVSGRGGRGDSPGRVIVQTFNPEHYAVRLAGKYDYSGFYSEEMANRKELDYPPYSRIINFRISHFQEDMVRNTATKLGKIARDECEKYGVQVIGPAEAPIAKIRGRYRWHMLLKGSNSGMLHACARDLLAKTAKSASDIKLDVDPVSFM